MNPSFFPIIMEDKRVLTNYVPSAIYEKQIQQKQHIHNNSVYRRYLVNNAKNIMEINKHTSVQQNIPMIITKHMHRTYPYTFDSLDQKNTPYGYETNQAKTKYLSSQELSSKKYNVYKQCNV